MPKPYPREFRDDVVRVARTWQLEYEVHSARIYNYNYGGGTAKFPGNPSPWKSASPAEVNYLRGQGVGVPQQSSRTDQH